MVEAVTTRRRETLNRTSLPGPLVLRICGSDREGQTIRLKSTKCTIGSGEHCTLRIRARGVQPLHCILIRKAARTVVRRWATDTLLNGASFSDAALNVGDRLAIGPIEFEVLESGTIPSGTSGDRALSAGISGGVGKGDSLVEHLQAAKDLARKRTEKILHRLRQANRQIELLTKEHGKDNPHGLCADNLNDQVSRTPGEPDTVRTEKSLPEETLALIRQQQTELDTARERWKAEQERSEGELQMRRSETDLARVELDSLRETIAKERKAIETEKARYEQFAEVIEKQRREVERQSEAVAGEFAELARQRDEAGHIRKELDSLREALANEREILLAERARLERLDADGSERQVEAAGQAATNSEKLADLELQREEIARAGARLDTERKVLRNDREAIDAERERHARLAADLQEQRSETERQSKALAQEATELRAERDAFADEQRKWEIAEIQARKQIEQRAEQLDRQKEALDNQKQALTTAKEEWQALMAEAEARLSARAEQLDERERQLDNRTAQLDRVPCPTNAFLKPSTAGELDFLDNAQETDEPARSMNSNDLFKQMRAVSPGSTVPLSDFSELAKILREDASASESADSEPVTGTREADEEHGRPTVSQILLADPVIADSFVPPPIEQQPVPSQPRGRPAKEEEQEESIEQYMAGLLARVNSGSPSSYSPPPAERAKRTPRATQASQERADRTDDSNSRNNSHEALQPYPAVGEPHRKRPRARAPERAEDLVTLRELANLSAQSALDTHARSRLMKSANAKLAVVTVALATAGILFFRWSIVPGSNSYFYTGLAVALVAIFWGVQYTALAAYAHLTGGPKTSDETEPAESKKETLERESSSENEAGNASQAVEAQVALPPDPDSIAVATSVEEAAQAADAQPEIDDRGCQGRD